MPVAEGVCVVKYLFVGGPLHGTERAVQPAPAVSLVDVVTGPDPEPPGQYVDVASGATYVFETVRVPVQSPMANAPAGFFERDMYLFSPLLGDAPQARAAHGDAVMRQWLAAGRRVTAEEADALDRKRFGEPYDSAPAVLYTVECRACETVDAVAEIGFDSLSDRAKWAAAHLEANPDHSLAFAEVAKGGATSGIEVRPVEG